MAKRKFTAKQLRAQRLFAKRAKAGTLRKTKRKSTKTKTKTRTRVITKIKRVSSMRRRRSTSRRRSSSNSVGGIINKIPVLKDKRVQKIAMAAGIGSLAATAAGFIPVPQVQQNAALIKTGVTFAADPIAGILSFVAPGLLNGSGLQTQSSNGGGMSGFA